MNVTQKTTVNWPLILLLATLSINAAADSDPLYTSNQSPVVMSYGIPAPESARLLQEGELSNGIFIAISSIAIEAHNANEVLTLDGESYNLNFRLRYGWSDHLQLGIDLAALRHEGGSLDGFVENWHGWFGLPNGPRSNQPGDRLLFRYLRDNQSLLEVSDNQSGIGDLRLSAIYQLKTTSDYQLAIRGGVKLPTGDADKLTGSDSTDVYLELLGSQVPDMESESITLHSGLGILHTGSGNVLGTIKEDWIGYGYATLAWGVSERINLKLQLNGHGRMYDSDLHALKDTSIELVMGGTATLSSKWVLDISVSEDIFGDSAPDFTVLLGLRYRMGAGVKKT